MYFLSKTLDVLLSPLAWVMILLALSFTGAPQRRRQPLLVTAAAVLLYAASVEPVANALWRELERSAILPRDLHYDAIVLLGGVVNHGATAAHRDPSYNDNVERLLVTYDLMRSDPQRPVIISGGRAAESDPIVEADVLGNQLAAWGVARERLLLEEGARNTRENAVNVARIAKEHGFDRLLVVTSAFHMSRALDCFREAGVDALPYPVDYRAADAAEASSWLPRAENLATTERALREAFGRWIYRLLGYGRAAT